MLTFRWGETTPSSTGPSALFPFGACCCPTPSTWAPPAKPMPSKHSPLPPTFRQRAHYSYALCKLSLFKPMPSKHSPLSPTVRCRPHCFYASYKLQLPLFKLTPSSTHLKPRLSLTGHAVLLRPLQAAPASNAHARKRSPLVLRSSLRDCFCALHPASCLQALPPTAVLPPQGALFSYSPASYPCQQRLCPQALAPLPDSPP